LRTPEKRKNDEKSTSARAFFVAMGYEKDGFAILSDGFELADRCFAKQSYRFSSLFSLLFSLEKVA